MNLEAMKKLIALLGLLAFAGCGASVTDGVAAGSGMLSVRVTGAKSFNPNIVHGKIEAWRVAVSGPGIAEAVVAEFPGDAEEGVVEGVPVGSARTVEVSALNPNRVAIRQGEAFGVDVGDGLNAVDVALEAVPIFANLADGASVENTRLVFRLFSEPGHPLVVEEIAGGEAEALVDAATNVPEVMLDASTGLGKIAPPLMAPGERVFAVRDLVTGRSSRVALGLIDGSKRRAAPLVAASASAKACAPQLTAFAAPGAK